MFIPDVLMNISGSLETKADLENRGHEDESRDERGDDDRGVGESGREKGADNTEGDDLDKQAKE